MLHYAHPVIGASIADMNTNTLVPFIEENIPLPENAKEAFPELSTAQELEMRANVIKLMSDLTGHPIVATQENVDQAKELAREMITNPSHRPEFAKYPNETLATLAGLVAQMNVSIVEELSELKMYVVNKLVAEIENSRDPKVRVSALGKLGEVDGVDAFKKRTEVTHKHLSIEEVENELLETLNNLENKVIDVEARHVENRMSPSQ
jgi:ribosomal protein L7/L12